MEPSRRNFLKLLGVGVSAPTCLLGLKLDRPLESAKKSNDAIEEPNENVVRVSPGDIYGTKDENPLAGLPLCSVRFDIERPSIEVFDGPERLMYTGLTSVTGHFVYLNTNALSPADTKSMIERSSPWTIDAGDRVYTFKGFITRLDYNYHADEIGEIEVDVSVSGEVNIERMDHARQNELWSPRRML